MGPPLTRSISLPFQFAPVGKLQHTRTRSEPIRSSSAPGYIITFPPPPPSGNRSYTYERSYTKWFFHYNNNNYLFWISLISNQLKYMCNIKKSVCEYILFRNIYKTFTSEWMMEGKNENLYRSKRNHKYILLSSLYIPYWFNSFVSCSPVLIFVPNTVISLYCICNATIQVCWEWTYSTTC